MSNIIATTLKNLTQTKSAPVADVIDGYAKAWVNFNGTGTVAIRAAFNVSSITDNGLGDYTANFTNSFSDANYAAVGTTEVTAQVLIVSGSTGAATASGFRFLTYNLSSATVDPARVYMAFFR